MNAEGLAALEASYAAAHTQAEYIAVRTAARPWPKSGSVGVHTASIAADCGFFLATAFSSAPDITQAAELIADLAVAMEVLKANRDTTPRVLAERLINIANAGCRLAYVGTRPGWEDPPRWAVIAAAVEAILPVDFRFDPKTAGEGWPDRTWQTANSLAALSILQGAPDHGHARCAKALEWLSSVGQLWLFQAACHDAIDLLEACRAARPSCAPNILWLFGFMSVQCDIWRGRPRGRAGRLFIAQMFATVLSRLLCAAMDIVRQPLFASLGEALHRYIFGLIEMARSNLLLDQMCATARPFADPAQAAAAMDLERTMLTLVPSTLSHDLAATERRLVSELPMVFWSDLRASAKAQSDFAARLAEVARLETLFVEADAGLVGAGQRPDLASVQQSLSPSDVFIIFAIPRETLHPARRLILFAITSAAIQTAVIDLDILRLAVAQGDGFVGALSLNGAEPIESSPLGDLVAITRIAIQDRRDDTARQRLAALYEVLIEPLKQLGIVPQAGQHWFISPSGPLHALPFAALVDSEGRHLGQLVSISHVPSASVFHKLRAAWAPGTSFAGFANPSLDRAAWKDLPKAETETKAAATILAVAGPKLCLGPDATLAAWHQDAPVAEIIHIATHGDFPEHDVIDLHAVLLTPGAGDNGRLTAERMLRSSLAKTRIVTLSVCNGGLVRFGPGDELHGLIPACLSAGAANVLTTLWSVGDSMTALWMRAFYRHLAQLGPAAASLAATSAMIADGAAIRDWASFVLIGAAMRTGSTTLPTEDKLS
jgi:CHAT domain-containing protein